MHERALMDDLVGKVLAVAEAEDASAVTRIRVRLGALSHFTPEHFRKHFEDASSGTLADGADVETRVRTDPTPPRRRASFSNRSTSSLGASGAAPDRRCGRLPMPAGDAGSIMGSGGASYTLAGRAWARVAGGDHAWPITGGCTE